MTLVTHARNFTGKGDSLTSSAVFSRTTPCRKCTTSHQGRFIKKDEREQYNISSFTATGLHSFHKDWQAGALLQ
jgi:hypothetical protein